MEIRTVHAPDTGDTHNIHNLSPAELKLRKIDIIDIVKDSIDKKHYRSDEDPSLYHSTQTKRGPLTSSTWYKSNDIPHMTCYKLVKVQFKYFGLQNKIESFIHKTAIREQFLLLNRKCFCWTDQWYGMTMDDIRRMESDTALKLSNIYGNNTQVQVNDGLVELPNIASRYTSSPKSKHRTRTDTLHDSMNDLSLASTTQHTSNNIHSPASKHHSLVDTPTQSRLHSTQ